MSCKHIEAYEIQPPNSSRAVHREECTQCFDSIDDPDGLDVCLQCYNGGCAGEHNHTGLHHRQKQHPLAVRIRRVRKTISRDEPPHKISKLAIMAETETDRYDTHTSVHCLECNVKDLENTSARVRLVVDGIMKASTSSRHEEVKAWEQEMTSCEHILLLTQDEANRAVIQSLGSCSMCDIHENLWLCLQCGNLGCGRAQFGGIGGSSHSLAHADTTQHPVAVKLGSITPEGNADVYCYECDEERVDDNLGQHLAHWGILLADRQKTEKSLTEMQIEQNLRWEFSMTSADGQELTPLFGPGFTGLKNLGNSCYLNSCFQCLLALSEFRDRYFEPGAGLPVVADPAADLETQLRKLAEGIHSGRYSKPGTDVVASENSSDLPHQRGIAPSMLKHLLGKGHEEFSTMRQQDAFEFLLHVLKVLARANVAASTSDPTRIFRFVMEQRLQCLHCHKVRYRMDEQDNISVPVPLREIQRTTEERDGAEGESIIYEPVSLKECLDNFTAEEVVELKCMACGSGKGFSKRSMFKSFPPVLTINARRFVVRNWVPTKVDIAVLVDDKPLQLDDYKAPARSENEELFEDESEPAVTKQFVADDVTVQTLLGMGFPLQRCQKALHAVGVNDVNTAMEWIFAHIDDADIDEPPTTGGAPEGSTASISHEKIEALGQMGFQAKRARQALKETGQDLDRAVDWLFSHSEAPEDDVDELDNAATDSACAFGSETLPATFQLQSIICHKGASIHAGHYVALIRQMLREAGPLEWVLYNDEKVAKAADIEDLKKYAYVYFLRRL